MKYHWCPGQLINVKLVPSRDCRSVRRLYRHVRLVTDYRWCTHWFWELGIVRSALVWKYIHHSTKLSLIQLPAVVACGSPTRLRIEQACLCIQSTKSLRPFGSWATRLTRPSSCLHLRWCRLLYLRPPPAAAQKNSFAIMPHPCGKCYLTSTSNELKN